MNTWKEEEEEEKLIGIAWWASIKENLMSSGVVRSFTMTFMSPSSCAVRSLRMLVWEDEENLLIIGSKREII